MECGCPIEAVWDKVNKCAKFKGYVKSVSSPKIKVECYVSERMMGSMTIDQQEYDLANGSLFLISFRSPGTKVTQINYDTHVLKDFVKSRKQLVEDIPEIRTFFEGTPNEQVSWRIEKILLDLTMLDDAINTYFSILGVNVS